MTEPQLRFFATACRVLGLVDQNPLSCTAGCADRDYWHYQGGKGFAVASFQVAMLGLAQASRSFPERRDTFSHASDLMLRWWAAEVLRGDGAVDEYFAHQGSFCATAYGAMAATILCADKRDAGEPIPDEVAAAVPLALRWLGSVRARPDSANQALAARIAWDVFHARCGGPPVGTSNPFSPRLTDEGWLSEYGGFDLGYSLKAVDLCALACWALGPRAERRFYARLAGSVLGLLHAAVVHYTFAPELGSRGNPQRLLGGLGCFAAAGDPRAREILGELQGPRFARLVSAESCDDKYCAFFHLTSLMLGVLAGEGPIWALERATAAETPPEVLHLERAGLLFVRKGATRFAACAAQSGLYCVDDGGTIRLGTVYVAGRDERLLVPAPGALHIARRDGDQVVVECELRAEPRRQRTRALQNPIVRLGLRVALGLPALGRVVRARVHEAATARRAPTVRIGCRRWFVSAAGVRTEDELVDAGRWGPLYEAAGWCFADGHATRMTGDAATRFTPVTDRRDAATGRPR